MAASKEIYCGQCEYDNITTPGTTWCTDCSEGYCNDCLKGHKAAKPSRNHHVIPISEYIQAEKFSVSATCPTHQKKLDFFCRDHESILCVICVQQKHSNCGDLLNLTEASQGVKTSTALTDLYQNIDCILTNIDKGVQSLQENQADIKKQEKTSILAIQKIREQIDQYLDSLQEKIIATLKTKSDECNKEQSSLITSLTQKRENLCGLKDSTTEMKRVASDLQAFIWIRNMLAKVRSTSEEVKPLINNIQEFNISFQSNEKVTSLVDVLGSFGQVLVTPKRQVCHFVDSNVVQAQHQRNLHEQGISNMRLQLKQMFQLDAKGLKVASCLLLPDKKMLFITTHNTNLIILNEDGSHHSDVSVPYHPFDATVIDNQRVAISSRNISCKEVNIVNIYSRQLEKSFSKCYKMWTWGISYYNEKLYFRSYGEGIKEIDLNGKVLRTIDVEDPTRQGIYYMTLAHDKIFYSSDYRVTCTDLSGKVIWYCLDDKISSPSYSPNLAVCSNGCVLVTGVSENIVMVISKDGKDKKILLDHSNGLNAPSAIHIDKNKVLVCNSSDGQAFLYEIIY